MSDLYCFGYNFINHFGNVRWIFKMVFTCNKFLALLISLLNVSTDAEFQFTL